MICIRIIQAQLHTLPQPLETVACSDSDIEGQVRLPVVIIMAENQRSQVPTQQRELTNHVNEFFYTLHYRQEMTASAFCVLRVLNTLLVFAIYLSLPEIGILSIDRAITGRVGGICLLGVVAVLLAQLLIGVLYNKQLFLKLQLSVYRNILWPIGMLSLSSQAPHGFSIELGVVCLASLGFVLLLNYLFGRESYSNHLLRDEGMPIDSYLIFYELFLCFYRTTTSSNHNLLLFLMLVVSACIRCYLLSSHYRKAKSPEYSLLKAESSLRLLCVANLLLRVVFSASSQQGTFYIFPLAALVVGAEAASAHVRAMMPIEGRYFNDLIGVSDFLGYTQTIIDEVREANSDSNHNMQTGCLMSFYYEHICRCARADCPVPHDLVAADFQRGSHKQLSAKVYRGIERLFSEYVQASPEDIELKMSFVCFYMIGFPNRFKIMQIITELEALSLGWMTKLRLYCVKRELAQMEVVELLENMKLNDSFDQFSLNMNCLLRLLVDFWAQFLEERVDFSKVVLTGQKLIPSMEAVEAEWLQSLRVENCSTMRAMKIYSEYCRCILNDQKRSQLAADYVVLLQKKLSQSHELHYLSADSETGLVAISLNAKNLGKIKMVNNQAAILFNYQKQELEKLKVNDLMPRLFAQHHDEFLRVFLNFENKKVNTDNRLIIGRKREGYLFEIFLQLQKSITTVSEELVFMASIELAKTSEAMVLMICDEQGHIMDTNSTFSQIFTKGDTRKEGKTIANIQELLPNFFENLYEEEGGCKAVKEFFDTSAFGVLEFRFETVKISFPTNPEAGYLVKGLRVQEEKKQLFTYLSLTNSLQELADEDKLEGMRMRYDPIPNEFIIEGSLNEFSGNMIGTQFTIPYLKLEDLAGVLGKDFETNIIKESYDMHIKTIRFCRDHFERVEEQDSFSSELDSQDKKNKGEQQLTRLKEEMAAPVAHSHTENARLLSVSLSLALFCLTLLIYLNLHSFSAAQLVSLTNAQSAHNFRAELAQYVVYYEAELLWQDQYFQEEQNEVRGKLTESINSAGLGQQQKEKAYLIMDWEEESSLESFLEDQVFSVEGPRRSGYNKSLYIFLAVLVVGLAAKYLFSLAFLRWHRKQLLKIFSLFISLPEEKIRKIHAESLDFVINVVEIGNQPEARPRKEEAEEPDDQNPHLKLKKFKNMSMGVETHQMLKINFFALILCSLIVFFAVLYSRNMTRVATREDFYLFAITVMPEYSMAMMKAYFHRESISTPPISEAFQEKYQELEFYMAEQSINDPSFFWMLDDVCSRFTFKPAIECEGLAGGAMRGGVSKMMNWVAARLGEITTSPPPAQSPELLRELTLILFDVVQPVMAKILTDIKLKLEAEYSRAQTINLIFWILIAAIIFVDCFYLHHYPLKEHMHSMKSSRSLVRLLPDAPTKEAKPADY